MPLSSQPMGTAAVTGAHGKTGRAVTAALAPTWDITALGRNHEQAAALRAAGHDVVVGDIADAETLRALFAGADAGYHICPNFHRGEVEIGQLVTAAARSVPRLVYHSVLHPQTEAMPHHWRKLRVEEHLLRERPGAVTFLRPAPYVQNLMPYLRTALSEGELRLPYSVDTTTAMVDLADVGLAAAAVLADDFEAGSGWDLCGIGAVSHREIAERFTRLTGRTITAVTVDPPSDVPGDVASMFEYMDRTGLPASTGQLRALIGAPTCFDTTLQQLVEEAREGGT